MDNKVVEQAVEDVQLIKQVIERTSNSLASFGRIFLWWGILLTITNAVGIILYFNFTSRTSMAIFNYIVQAIVFILGIFIYFKISRKIPLVGLSKKLMAIWLYIISFDFIYANLSHLIKFSAIDSFPTILLSFAFGMLCIYIFTSYKFPIVLSLVYALTAIFALPITRILPYSILFRVPFISSFFLPIAFLLLGGYLEIKRSRGNLA